MTKVLRTAFEAAPRLPDREQDEFASALPEELATDERWEVAFAESQAALARLASEAIKKHRPPGP